MFTLNRYSFRQLLLVAFLLIAALLGAASLRGLFQLEGLLQRSSAGAREAVATTSAAQVLAERSVSMERAARQYLVLDDPGLRQRFDDASREATEALDRLRDTRIPPEHDAAWRRALAVIEAQLRGPPATLSTREMALTAAFRDIEALNITLAEQVRIAADRRSQALLQELEQGRVQLVRQVIAAIVGAVMMAFGFGWWLSNPFRRLEKAIARLGENRLDEPIEIRGPTDVRLLGRRLDWLRLRLAELDADKARFLRHVSHELKTPLAALREGTALLEDGTAGTLSDNQREIARILRGNTVLLQAQIEDLLRFNAAAFEARRLVRRKVELVALIGDLIKLQQLQWQARQLKVEVTGRPLWTEVDPEKLGTALGNLLSNAIRFSTPGATIRFAVSRLPGRACIDIIDAGPGIASVDRARVFEPFYRGERQPTDAPRGSGIGLSIVQEYITAHGGQIELMPERADGSGAHFHIELPNAS